MPIKTLVHSNVWMVIHHPEPAYPIHILITSKQGIEDVTELGEKDGKQLIELFKIVRELVEKFELEHDGYRLIVNGGKFQEAPVLHFHLVSGDLG